MSKDHEILLVDEDGVEHHFELYRIIELDGVDYALLQAPEDEDELIILRIEGSIDSGNLVTLDDEEWERVTAQIDGLGLLDDDDFDDDFDDDDFDDDFDENDENDDDDDDDFDLDDEFDDLDDED